MPASVSFPIVVVVFDEPDIEDLLPLAATLARARDSELLLLGLVEVEPSRPLSDGIATAQHRRGTLDQIGRRLQIPVRTRVRVAHSLYEGICEAVRDEQASLLLVGWRTDRQPAERIFGPPLDRLLASPPCDLVLIKQQTGLIGRRILLPTNGGPHLSLSSEIASALAEAADGHVTILHASDPHRPPEHLALEHIREVQQLPRMGAWLERSAPVLPAILEAALESDVVVLGATGRRLHPSQPVGPLGEALLKEVDRTVVITRRVLADVEARAVERFEARRDTSARVDKWFAENTFSAEEFADLDQLLALKYRRGITISLVLPALNEAETIGPLIDAIKGPFLEQVPLLDEIVLIDSRSSDETRIIAADRGIPVFIHQEILPQYGSFAGKGEALWKSLYVTHGDIVVWIDTDIKDMHPRFVYGLIGPLLREPRLQFTKGFYQRPINYGGQLIGAGGGRVTELVARPLVNLFFPELSGFIQPLAGEYAGRREVLQRLPFFTGYSVEIGLLIDLLQTVGLTGMAQVDLQQRIHRNQELHGLSRMAFAIIQAVMHRLEAHERLQLLDPLTQSLKLIRPGDAGGYRLDVCDIRDHERPPIETLPEYIERHALAGAGEPWPGAI